MDLAATKTIDNPDKSRFELAIGEHIAFVDYKVGKSGNWYLVHTEVPKTITLKGVGNKLVRESLNILDEREIKIVPSCPFVKAFIKRNLGEYGHLVIEGYNLD